MSAPYKSTPISITSSSLALAAIMRTSHNPKVRCARVGGHLMYVACPQFLTGFIVFFVFLCAWDLFVLLMVSIDCRTAVDVRFLLVSLWTLRAWGLFVLLMVSTNGRTAVGGRVFFNHLVCCHCVHVSLYAWGLFVLVLVSTDGRSAVGGRVFF